MKQVTAFSPGHITGFFQICDHHPDPLVQGSRGAGVSILKGVKTTVIIETASKTSFQIRINGRVTRVAHVSTCVINTLLPKIEGKFRILVHHEAAIPIGAGFGSSGAGALGLALAMNKIFALGLSPIETAQIAHVAEVQCKTGLGTVIAETYGGLEIRIKPGAPGIGEILQIPLDDDYVVACLFFGPISTEKMLSNHQFRERINKFGGELVDQLASHPTPRNFMKFSQRFAQHVSLMSRKMKAILREADDNGFICSMAMFGNSLFSVLVNDQVEDLLTIFRRYAPSKHSVMVTEIDFKGARII